MKKQKIHCKDKMNRKSHRFFPYTHFCSVSFSENSIVRVIRLKKII